MTQSFAIRNFESCVSMMQSYTRFDHKDWTDSQRANFYFFFGKAMVYYDMIKYPNAKIPAETRDYFVRQTELWISTTL